MFLTFCWVSEHGGWESGPLGLRKDDSLTFNMICLDHWRKCQGQMA